MTTQVRINLRGTSPLLMHNPRMVDPEFEINRQIKALTGKRKKTEADLRDIERLEWFGGLYTDLGNDVVTQPCAKVRKCIIQAAKISRQGKQVERALTFLDLHVPLAYEGPKSPEQLFKDKKFHSRLSVGVNGKRVMRVRPSFTPWALSTMAMYIPDAGINLDEIEAIIKLAGLVEGIGDNRVNGYGRFVGSLEVIKD